MPLMRAAKVAAVLVLGLMMTSCRSSDEGRGALSASTVVGSCLASSNPPVLCFVDSVDGAVSKREDVVVDVATAVQVSPDRRRVALIQSDALVIFDMADGQPERHPPSATVVRWLSDGDLIYRAGPESALRAYELADGAEREVSLTAVLPTGAEPYPEFDIAAAGAMAAVPYALDDRNHVALLATEDWSVLDTIDLPDGIVDYIAIAPDGGQVAIAVDNVLWLWSSEDSELQQISPSGSLATTPSFSPTGDSLVYVDGRGVLMRYDREGQSLTALVDNSGGDVDGLPVFPDWSS